jgi:enhancer of polycomb-like protein
LQAVISASQVKDGETAANVYIPTPDASQLIDYYDAHYNRAFKLPKSLIRYSCVVEDSVGVPYCMDERDQVWLTKYNTEQKDEELKLSEDAFEGITWELEKLTDEKQREVGQCLFGQPPPSMRGE